MEEVRIMGLYGYNGKQNVKKIMGYIGFRV